MSHCGCVVSVVGMHPSPVSALLVAYYFPPINVVAAQRILRIARVLLTRYKYVYVLRLGSEGLDPSVLDHEYGRDVLDHPRIRFLDCKPLLDRRGYSASPSLPHRVVGGILTRLFCDHGLDWAPAVSRCLRSIGDVKSIGMIVGSGPPFVPLIPVARWASRHSIPMVLDYRDLWTKHPAAPYPRVTRFLVNRFLERPINRIATTMTTVSRGCREMLLHDSPDTPIQVLLNVPDAAYRNYFSSVAESFERQVQEKRQCFRIVFTGQVYAHCTFSPLLNVMLRLPGNALEKIEVHYYGGCSEMVSREFDQFGLGRHLSDHGRVSKEDSIKAILGADLLLSLIHTESTSSSPSVSGLMTTKVYDYFLSGNPVLSVGPSDAEVNWFAKSIGYSNFFSFSADETELMACFLRQCLTKKPPPSKATNSVSMPDFATDLEQILIMAEKSRA